MSRRCAWLALALGFASAIAGLVAAAGAEQPRTIPVLGILFAAAGPDDPIIEALRRGLREFGYVEGQTIRFEFRGAQGHDDRLPRLAQELVQLKVDVIFAGTANAIRATKQATRTIPIVALMHDQDPVASGLIESFNRPGGNITGIYQRQQELAGKRLELLKEALPSLSRVAVFWDPCCPGELAELKRAGRLLGIKLELIELRTPYDFETAFRIAKQKKAGAAIVMYSAGFYVQRARIGALAVQKGFPAMGQFHDFTEAGGLMSYGHEMQDSFFRFAYFIDRLLKGAKPGELPVEQVATFKLVVNLKTAKTLGITVPQSILLQADEVTR